ncbi:MAG: hypothetical protein R6V83_00530 [Candidatus Thorarchaeota archaeon]
MPTDLEEIKGIGPTTGQKLQDAGISSAEMLAYQVPGDLRIRGLKEDKLAEFIRLARDLLPFTKLRPATEIEEELNHTPQLTTGSPTLDNRLQGGLYAGSLVEFYGLSASGKSQWCHQFAVTSQLPREHGGLGGGVIWLDYERGFNPLIIRAAAIRFELDPDEVISNIRHATILTQDHMVDYLDTLRKLCSEDTALVVCDCLGFLFPAETEERIHYSVTINRLRTILQAFNNLALATDTTFLYTNQLYRHYLPQGGSYLSPLNGNLMGQMSDYRFKTRARSPPEKRLYLVDAPDIPPFEFRLSLSWGGLYDLYYPRPPKVVIEYVNEELGKWYPGIIDEDDGELLYK